jgi:bacterioferritin (cytochrome b1)
MIEYNGDSFSFVGELSKVDMYRLITLKGALKLELLGMERNGDSVSSILRRDYKFEGGARKIYWELEHLTSMINDVEDSITEAKIQKFFDKLDKLRAEKAE